MPPSLDLTKLGLPGQAPYVPNLPQAPVPTVPTTRKKPLLVFDRGSRLEKGTIGERQQAGAVIGGLVAALNQFDHFLRQAKALNFLDGAAKYLLGQLVELSDKMLGQYARSYSNSVATMANTQGLLLGQQAELLLQLTPRQQQASLTHLHNMAQSNAAGEKRGLAYVPAPVAPRGPLPNPNDWRRVVVESPYAGEIERNLRYLRACLRDCLTHGDAPIASHGLYTQAGVLDDTHAQERALGIDAGLCWAELANATVVYTDLGISPGMETGIIRAENEGRLVIYRSLPEWRALDLVSADERARIDYFMSRPGAVPILPEQLLPQAA